MGEREWGAGRQALGWSRNCEQPRLGLGVGLGAAALNHVRHQRPRTAHKADHRHRAVHLRRVHTEVKDREARDLWRLHQAPRRTRARQHTHRQRWCGTQYLDPRQVQCIQQVSKGDGHIRREDQRLNVRGRDQRLQHQQETAPQTDGHTPKHGCTTAVPVAPPQNSCRQSRR